MTSARAPLPSATQMVTLALDAMEDIVTTCAMVAPVAMTMVMDTVTHAKEVIAYPVTALTATEPTVVMDTADATETTAIMAMMNAVVETVVATTTSPPAPLPSVSLEITTAMDATKEVATTFA